MLVKQNGAPSRAKACVPSGSFCSIKSWYRFQLLMWRSRKQRSNSAACFQVRGRSLQKIWPFCQNSWRFWSDQESRSRMVSLFFLKIRVSKSTRVKFLSQSWQISVLACRSLRPLPVTRNLLARFIKVSSLRLSNPAKWVRCSLSWPCF